MADEEVALQGAEVDEAGAAAEEVRKLTNCCDHPGDTHTQTMEWKNVVFPQTQQNLYLHFCALPPLIA